MASSTDATLRYRPNVGLAADTLTPPTDVTTSTTTTTPLRPTLSRSSTQDNPTPFHLSDQDDIFSGLGLLDLINLIEAHLELWMRPFRKKSTQWKSKADKLVEESKARARLQMDKLPRVSSETFIEGLLEKGQEKGVLKKDDLDKLEKRYRELGNRARDNMKKLSAKWEEE